MELALTVPSPERVALGRALAEAHTWVAAAERHLDFYRAR
jgi:hypothetical protein